MKVRVSNLKLNVGLGSDLSTLDSLQSISIDKYLRSYTTWDSSAFSQC